MSANSLRFYVLTSRNFKCVKRQFLSLPKEHTTVIINTLDNQYASEVFAWCKQQSIDVEITESNGRPGKGKNSCLDHFLTNSYAHMLLIDGDDFVQPHGVNYYSSIAARKEDAPDGVQIVYSKSWSNAKKPDTELFCPFPWMEQFRGWASKKEKEYPFLRAKIREVFDDRHRLEKAFKIHEKQNQTWNYPPDSMHYMDCARLILWSRKLAGMIRFREDLIIGEDSLLNYEVRDLSYRGDIYLQKVKDNQQRTYYYDLCNSGIVRRLQNRLEWEWLFDLNAAISAREAEWAVPTSYGLSTADTHIYLERVPDIDLKEHL